MSDKNDRKPIDRREAERRRLLALKARRWSHDDSRQPGVLLSDVIQHYCEGFDLISPFNEKNLKPACYKLTIGDEYAIAGKIHPLSDQPGNNELRIPAFAVAIIKTRETINMPCFLIGRWNIQVSRAYQGLVWVGGPQVDAGYVGHLFCPVYNLSDQEVVLYSGDAIAVIDFEKTTKFDEAKSKLYSESGLPENILFEDYKPHRLGSGLVKHAAKIEGFEAQINAVQGRVDTFVSLTFAVVAVLFAALTIFVARPDTSAVWNPALFLITGMVIFLSMSSWIMSRAKNIFLRGALQVVLIVLALALSLQIFWVGDMRRQIEELGKEVGQLKSSQATSISPPTNTVHSPKGTAVQESGKSSPPSAKP